MKFFKKIFSRLVGVILTIILQIAIIVGLVVFALLSPRYGWIGIVIYCFCILLNIIFFFRVINRKDSPDFKIPWMVALTFMPFLGVLVYIFFGNHGMKSSYNKILNNVAENSYKYFDYDPKRKRKEHIDFDKKFFGVFDYLHNVSYLKPFSGNKVTYFGSGEEFFPEFIQSLKKAKDYIFIEFFIINKGKEWNAILDILKEKAANGVEVRVLYDDVGCIGLLPSNYPKKLRKFGIKCFRFNPFIPVLSGIFNNRDHRKIAVIDGDVSYTGGINLADEYANDIVRFGYWKDAMVKVEGPATKSFTHLFLSIYDLCTDTISDYSKYLTFDYSKKKYGDSIVFPFGDGPRPFYDELIGEQTFINMFGCAQKSIYISSPYLIPTYNLISALKNAALRGLDVKLMVPGIPDKKIAYTLAKSNFECLANAGVKIYIYKPGFNHEKAIVIDNELAFIGTINLDYRSLVHHFECGAIIYKGDVIENINNDLLETCEKKCELANLDEEECEDNCHIKKKYRLGFWARIFCSLLNIIAPLF